jgi:hypothetical protein
MRDIPTKIQYYGQDPEYQRLQKEYERVQEKRAQCVAANVTKPERLLKFACPDSLPKGTRLAHCTDSPGTIKGILTQGIRQTTSTETNQKKIGELGQGLYVGLPEDGYFGGEGKTDRLIFEAVEDVPTLRIPYWGDFEIKPYLAPLGFVSSESQEFKESFSALERAASVIERETRPPNDIAECVFRDPQGRWKPIAYDHSIDMGKTVDTRSIEKELRVTEEDLHDQFKQKKPGNS